MSFADIVDKRIVPIGDAVIGLLFALAFIVFLIGMVRFFFLQEGEEGREKGKKLAIWGIIGLVVMFSTWGIVHVLLNILTEVSA
jgi:heme/copper-type cytochrome/quinol oxidase subunit 4